MSKKLVTSKIKLNDRTLQFEVGRFAQQADGAVMVRCGDSVALVTVVASLRESTLGYMPLTVEFKEKLYAGGIIKGSRWVKREGRPSDEAIISARMIDRSSRPLFYKNWNHETQIIVIPLSVDAENSIDILSQNGAAAALAISNIPLQDIAVAVRVGLIDDKFIINPTKTQLEKSSLDLIISGTKEAIVMVEAGAKEVAEAQIIDALKFAHDHIKKIIITIDSLVDQIKPVKRPVPEPTENLDQLKKEIKKKYQANIDKLIPALASKEISSSTVELVNQLKADFPDQEDSVGDVLEAIIKDEVRTRILKDKVRPDGRKADEIRSITGDVGFLPRTHGSAEFKRGATQALTVTTLGSPRQELLMESMEGESTKRYIHHYNMLPFSVGEARYMGWPSRRDIGHGHLAELALSPMIPDSKKFPYTIRVVSEIVSSNGSTSQASICGSTLSLMDAGVPIKRPVSGIAMGLVAELDNKGQITNHVVLSDIMGIEDFYGDMDFKVAGTTKGITALQMDVKLPKIDYSILSAALEQAKVGRQFILDKMLAILPEPRQSLSSHAPKIEILSIPVEKIGDLIGPSGKTIKKIIAETGAQVDVEDDGSVFISTSQKDQLDQAKKWIQDLVRIPEPGEVFPGKVARVTDFGCFVEFLPGRQGLIHVSRLSSGYVENPSQLVKEGDEIEVVLNEIDDQGRYNLSPTNPLPAPEGSHDRRPMHQDRRRDFGHSQRNNNRRSRPQRQDNRSRPSRPSRPSPRY
jgi:polyribonucleotide nucleotidyltransferase